MRIWCGDIELHLNADIAYAVWRYWQATGDALLIGSGKCDYIRECLDKALEVGNDGIHLGLLQHNLTEPDVVRARLTPPGHLPLILLEPLY